MERIPQPQQFASLHQSQVHPGLSQVHPGMSQVHPGLSPYHHPGHPQLEHPTHIAHHPAAIYGGQIGRHKKPRKNKYRQHEVIDAPVAASYPGPHLYETNPLPPIQAPVPVEYSPYHHNQVVHPEHAYGPGFQHAGHPLVNGGYLEFHGSKPTYPNVHGFVPRARDHHGWGGQGAQGHHRGVITGYPNANANYTSKRV